MGMKLDRQEMQARKAADWATVQERHPDVAAHISDFASVFGKTALLRVTDDLGGVLLDSRRHK